MKECSRCKETKDTSEFSRDKHHFTGFKSACKKCAGKDHKKWREFNLDKVRENDRLNHYISSYGMTREEAVDFVNNRERPCSICGNVSKLVVDHCHTSGIVRGHICSACNSVLGYAKDNITILERAIEYLRDFYAD